MTSNHFLQNPVKIVVFDPIRNLNRRTFIFLGDVAKNVFNACHYYHTVTSSQRAAYDKLLREFYGSDFKSKLGLDIKDYSHGWIYTPDKMDIIGGSQSHEKYAQNVTYGNVTYDDDPEFTNKRDEYAIITGAALDDEIDDSDIEELLNAPTQPSGPAAPAKAAKLITSSVSAEELRADFEPGIEYITDVQVFPEDKFSELKEKIYLAANIPAYRQHMFYIDRNRLRTVYQLHAEGIYNADIRTISQLKDNVHGIPIDERIS